MFSKAKKRTRKKTIRHITCGRAGRRVRKAAYMLIACGLGISILAPLAAAGYYQTTALDDTGIELLTSRVSFDTTDTADENGARPAAQIFSQTSDTAGLNSAAAETETADAVNAPEYDIGRLPALIIEGLPAMAMLHVIEDINNNCRRQSEAFTGGAHQSRQDYRGYYGNFNEQLAEEQSFEEIETSELPEAVPEGAIMRMSADINMRTGASMYAHAIMTLKEGQTVKVVEYVPDGWSVIRLGGESGYVLTDYLTDDLRHEVELLPWSDARNIIPAGAALQIIDVQTGITYNIQCSCKGKHADVEPLTRNDTDTMKEAFGGSWRWTPRPVWVLYDGRVFAASISGMPHSGSTIANNGMNGHNCLHFLRSRTHNGNIDHERNHQTAVMEAWNMSG